MKKFTFLVEVIEKGSVDSVIKFKCKALSESDVVAKYKLNGSDILTYKIKYIKE